MQSDAGHAAPHAADHLVVNRPTVVVLGILALTIAACGADAAVPTATPSRASALAVASAAPPSDHAGPAPACASESGEGQPPEPRALPEDATIQQLEVARAVDLPAEPYFLAASGDLVWATLADGSVVKVDGASGTIVGTLSIGPDLGAAWPAFGFGSLWVARLGDGVLMRIDPVSMEVESEVQLEPGDRPMTIAFGDETLWIANQSRNTVTEVDPVGDEVVRTVDLTGAERPADPAPSGLAVTSGSLWISEHRADAIARLNPADGKVASTCHGSPEGGRLASAGGALWLVDAGGGVVSRIEPDSGMVSDRLFLPMLGGEVSVATDGVWVGSMTHVVRIDPAQVEVDAWAVLPNVVDDPDRLIVGGLAVAATDAAVWTTDPSGNRLLQIPTAP